MTTREQSSLLIGAMLIALVLTLLTALSLEADSTDYPVITLSESNTISLNDEINADTAKDIQIELLNKSMSTRKPLYLVLDSPGGSITAGQSIIETAKGIKNKVHTISLFSASMSFIVSQYLDKRYVLESSTLMSHRASISGVGGNVPGSAMSRMFGIFNQIADIDDHVAQRAGMTRKEYEDFIRNELWMTNYAAVRMHFADETVRVRCDKSLVGNKPPKMLSFFGIPIKVVFHKCPLITAPVSVSVGETSEFTKKAIWYMFYDKATFVKQYGNLINTK